VEFCHQLGLDYVSCSPYRLPIARLAAAQAVLHERGAGGAAAAAPAPEGNAGKVPRPSGRTAPRKAAVARRGRKPAGRGGRS